MPQALEDWRWARGFVCPSCGHAGAGVRIRSARELVRRASPTEVFLLPDSRDLPFLRAKSLLPGTSLHRIVPKATHRALHDAQPSLDPGLATEGYLRIGGWISFYEGFVVNPQRRVC